MSGSAPTNAAAAAASDEKINLVCQDQSGAEVHFKVRKNMPFRKLMEAYAERQGRTIQELRFTFEGNRLDPTQTPEDLDMEADDVIDVFEQQTGGL